MRFLLLSVFALVLAGNGFAQSTASEVFDKMIEAYEANMDGVDDYTVVSDAFTSYHRRVSAAGPTKFETATTSAVGGMGIGNMTTRFSTDNPYAMKELYVGASNLIGEGSFDGADVHMIRVDPSAFSGDTSDVDEMVLHVDSQTWSLRGMTIKAASETEGQTSKMVIHFEDYRDDQGFLFPYRTRVVMPNPDVDVDDEQVSRAREALAQIEERMAEMPEAQRQAMQRMMASQIERMEQLAAGGDLETVYNVSELRVNTGIDPAIFQN